jgi:Protein of unknown function (DUF1580)
MILSDDTCCCLLRVFFMIDTVAERPIPLDQIPPEAIPGRGGNPVHKVTLSLWHRRGIRGIRLETIMVGGRRCTSLEALSRFYQAISQKPDPHHEPKAIATRTRRQKNKAVRKAIDELAESGA